MTHSALPFEHQDIKQQTILEEAAEWLTLIHSGEFTEVHQKQLQQWQAQSPAHQSTWNKAEAILKTLHTPPGSLTRQTLEHVDQHSRRRMIKTFAIMLLATPTVWLGVQLKPWQTWSADLNTAKGEQKTVELADGSQLILNTASSVKLNFSETQRHIKLIQGEILIKTAADPADSPRPFIVSAEQGQMLALGTEFAIRQFDEHVLLAVLEGAVEVTTLNRTKQIIHAGKQTTFTKQSIGSTQQTSSQTALWTKGMLLAKAMRLEDLVTELSRYHTGKIRCEPAIAEMKVSGAFPVTDIPACLTLLYKTLPLRVSYITRWWITLQPL